MNRATVMSPAGMYSGKPPAPRIELLEHLVARFPARVSHGMTREELYRTQGRQEVLDYLLKLSSPEGASLVIKETLQRVLQTPKAAAPDRGPPAPGTGGGQGAVIPGAPRS